MPTPPDLLTPTPAHPEKIFENIEDLRRYASISLPEGIRWEKEPRFLRRLREKLEMVSASPATDRQLIISLTHLLKFLEKGVLVDNYGSDEQRRDQDYANTKLIVNGQETTLFEVAEIANKLKRNSLYLFAIAIEVIEYRQPSIIAELDTTIKEIFPVLQEKEGNLAERLNQHIIEIDEKKGYFEPADLEPFDQLAKAVIKKIGEVAGVEISDEDFEED